MRYRELVVEVNKEVLQDVVDALASIDITSLVIDDPEDLRDIEEHPEWYKYDYINEELGKLSGQMPKITIYFSDDEEGAGDAARAEDVLRDLKERLSASEEIAPSNEAGDSKPAASLSWTLSLTGDDSEWLYRWQEHFKPTKVGERFVVKPSWESYDAKPGELVIEMDPGMAFGSGLHETTTLCIKALEQSAVAAQENSDTEEVKAKGLAGFKVLDVGTGTGILSIAAALLGAEHCLGIEIDPDAVEIAKSNIERNGLAGLIDVKEGDLTRGVEYEADIIVANLMSDLVIRLAPDAARHLGSGGIFISSGILDTKEEEVADAVIRAGFEIKEILHDGEWCAIIASRF